MRGNIVFITIWFMGSLMITGCSGPMVGVTVVDERTVLENQILGSYQELNHDVLLLASVRYIDPKGKLVQSSPVAPGKKKAVRAVQRSSFNKDDIDSLKRQGIVGENNQGGLTLLAPEHVKADQKAFVANVIQEENTDRDVIMRRVIETTEKLRDEDFPRVQQTFAALNRDKALVGDLIQMESGKWVKKATP